MLAREILQQERIVTDLARLLGCRHWGSRLKLFSPLAARSMLFGDTRSRFRGRGMEFEEVRRYQAGDDVRNIDWKVSARVGDTFTKVFCEERERPCHLLIDQRPSMFFGSDSQFKSVLAAELACALAWAALAGGDRVGGQIIGSTHSVDCRARRSKHAVLRLIHELHAMNHALLDVSEADISITAVKDEENYSLATALSECQRIARPGTAIFIISDFFDFDELAAKALLELGRHTDLSLFQIVDTFEKEMPITGRVVMSDGEERRAVLMNEKLKDAYRATRLKQQTNLRAAVKRAHAHFIEVDNRQGARQVLQRIFAR